MASGSPQKYTSRQLKMYAVPKLWRAGDLRYKLKPVQWEMHAAIEASNAMSYIIKCSRRLGKSFYLANRGTMRCLKQPGAIVRYGAPTNKSLKTILHPIMRTITTDCPNDLMPRWSVSDSAYYFEHKINGKIIPSAMYASGLNAGHAESLRGNYCDEFLIDEAGTVDDLTYVVKDIAMPQLLDASGIIVQGRRIILSGTPPRTPAHEFTALCDKAFLEGNISVYDIYAADYPVETIEKFKKEAGGENSTTWKREYLAQDVVDENYALIPEWDSRHIQEPGVDDKFQFYHKYESLDIGVRDLTVALFGHYDFLRATLYIHKEVVVSGPQMTTELLARKIREAEEQAFGRNPKVYKRVSDNELLLVNDLRILHGINFSVTDKGYLEEMINEVRIWVNAGRVKVDPSCKQLIGCLHKGIWNERRDEFERVPEYGHFDALASLMYLIRNVDRTTNPIPIAYGRSEQATFFPDYVKQNKNRDTIKKIFNKK